VFFNKLRTVSHPAFLDDDICTVHNAFQIHLSLIYYVCRRRSTEAAWVEEETQQQYAVASTTGHVICCVVGFAVSLPRQQSILPSLFLFFFSSLVAVMYCCRPSVVCMIFRKDGIRQTCASGGIDLIPARCRVQTVSPLF
jgi:hypothetical protein